MNKRRKYASFFEWPDKQLKELGIVQEFIGSLSEHGVSYRDPRINKPDPPDCICLSEAGGQVALEVVELVSQAAIEANQNGEHVYGWWEPKDILTEVSSLLSRKDGKTFNGGPYADVAVVIHTDEPVLTAEEARKALCGVTFGPFKQLTRAFLIFSYVPGKGYEVLQLSFVPNREGQMRGASSPTQTKDRLA